MSAEMEELSLSVFSDINILCKTSTQFPVIHFSCLKSLYGCNAVTKGSPPGTIRDVKRLSRGGYVGVGVGVGGIIYEGLCTVVGHL